MTTKFLQDEIRKSTVDFKRRCQLNSQKCSRTARKEAREGKTCETDIGLNLKLTSIVSSPTTDFKARIMAMPPMVFTVNARNLNPKLKQIVHFLVQSPLLGWFGG